MSRIAQLRRIVADKQFSEVDGQVVDTFTASAILACYDVGNDRTREIIETAALDKVAALAMRSVS